MSGCDNNDISHQQTSTDANTQLRFTSGGFERERERETDVCTHYIVSCTRLSAVHSDCTQYKSLTVTVMFTSVNSSNVTTVNAMVIVSR